MTVKHTSPQQLRIQEDNCVGELDEVGDSPVTATPLIFSNVSKAWTQKRLVTAVHVRRSVNTRPSIVLRGWTGQLDN